MEWRINATCPKGHLNVLHFKVDQFGLHPVMMDGEHCEVCEHIKVEKPRLGKMAVWRATRKARKSLRDMPEWMPDV